MAWVAAATHRVRVGTTVLVLPMRNPLFVAKALASVDQMSGGRVELGLGAGWYQQEHEAYGIPFPPLGERFERLEEQLEIITGMWSTPVGETFESPGGHYPVTASPALPKPVQSSVPIVIGGGGPKKTPALAARFASEFNTPFVPRDFFVAQCDRVRAACEAIDRDPATMTFSAALVLCCGADEAEVGRRADAIGREPAELRQNGAAGTPDEVAATLRSWADAGAERIYLQVLDLADLEHLDLVATSVADALR
jgi:alkanesulfonate monooxygenase SsuD/methylene tetrahydromethanopterin reductase-like flavin-dependent oxidoreductase (luciferase family)